MGTFAAIQTRVNNYTIDLPAATVGEIPGYVNRAVKFAQDVHNFRHMEAEQTFTTTKNIRQLGSKPATWKEARDRAYLVYNDGATKEIDWLPSRSEAVRRFGDSTTLDIGAPKVLLEQVSAIDVYPHPDGLSDYVDKEYRLTVPYWNRLADLSDGTDTNWFTDNAEDYLVFFAAAEAMTFNRDYDNAAVLMTKAIGVNDPGAISGARAVGGELQRLIRIDKRSRLAKRITLKPVRDVRANLTQRRM